MAAHGGHDCGEAVPVGSAEAGVLGPGDSQSLHVVHGFFCLVLNLSFVNETGG